MPRSCIMDAISVVSAFLTISCCVTVVSPQSGVKPQYWDINNFPNPQTNASMCRQNGMTSYLCDPNNLLSYSDASKVDATIADVRTETLCPCVSCPSLQDGYMMAVAVVPWVKLPPNVVRTSDLVERAIETFAVNLRQKWNFGTCANDAVMVLSVYDRKLFTSTGLTTVVRLSSECVSEISGNAKDKLGNSAYADAISQILLSFKDTINDDGNCATGGPVWAYVVGAIVGFTVVIGGVCCCMRFVRGGMRGGGRGGIFFSSNDHHHSSAYSSGGGGGGGGGGFSSSDGGGGGGASW